MLSHLILAQANSLDTADQRGMLMSIFVWLFVGLVAGFLGSKIVNKRGEGLVLDIVLGLIGSVVGGFIFSLFGVHGGASLMLSIVIATVGAVVVLVIYHKLIHRTSTV